MSRSLSAGLAMLLVASALAGCAQRCACVDGGAKSTPVTPQPTELRIARTSLVPDLAALSSYQAVDRALNQPAAVSQYRVLRAEEVQCMAAASAPLAKLYDGESQAVANSTRRRDQRSAPAKSKLLAYRAVDERNKAAGSALQLFYSLAEAEANRDVLAQTVAESDRASADYDQLKHSGLKTPLDATAFRRQKLDCLDQLVQLRSAVYQAQGQLQQLCDLQADETMPIWPEADLTVSVAPIDVEAAIGLGLANRADVGALRMLSGSLDADSLPAARDALQPLGSGLGTSMISKRLFGGEGRDADEAQTRQAQLADALSTTERTASREIAAAAENVEAQLRGIAVARQRQQLWAERVANLAEKREADGVTAFDLSAARLELLHAESDTIHRVIAWKIAQVKLKQTQGLLAAECGYCVPQCCE